MRTLLTIVAFVLMIFANGCASALYGSGKYKDVLHRGVDHTTIVQHLGEPIRHGVDKFGRRHEVFRATGRIAPSEEDVNTYRLGEGMTLGVGDVLWTPVELVRTPLRSSGEKDVDVTFDENGKYLYHEVRRAEQE